MAGWRYPGIHAVTTKPREDRRGFAIALMMAAFACFTVLDSSAKMLVTEGMSPLMAAFARYTVHLVIVAALILPQQGTASLHTSAPGLEIVRGVCLGGSTILNFIAVGYLPLTLTSTILFMIPIFICALSVPMLGEKVGLRRWSAIAVGFCGILVVTRPWTGDFHWAMLVSFGAAFFAAIYTVLTRRLAGVDSTNTQQLYSGLVATVLLVPLAILNWELPATPLAWILFGAMGVMGWSGHQMLTTAHRYAPAAVLAPFIYVQLLYMTASSWLIFHQPPSIWIGLGAPIVIASGIYIWWRERHLRGDLSA
ncbi:MAG: DMT family transporter [Pseudomonadota bacterium]